MKVKNVFVSEKESFEEQLIQELIHQQIGYVQIEDEFHFLDYIYRFYDQADLELLKDISKMEKISDVLNLFEPDDFLAKNISFQEVLEVGDMKPSSPSFKKNYHKGQLKADNRATTQYMKQYRK